MTRRRMRFRLALVAAGAVVSLAPLSAHALDVPPGYHIDPAQGLVKNVPPIRQAVPIVVPNGPEGDYDGAPVVHHVLPVPVTSAQDAYEARLTKEFCQVRPELCP
jgi:hypothetical protein